MKELADLAYDDRAAFINDHPIKVLKVFLKYGMDVMLLKNNKSEKLKEEIKDVVFSDHLNAVIEKIKDEEKREMIKELTEMSLMNLTRRKIRRHLYSIRDTELLPDKIDKLSLPSKLKDSTLCINETS